MKGNDSAKYIFKITNTNKEFLSYLKTYYSFCSSFDEREYFIYMIPFDKEYKVSRYNEWLYKEIVYVKEKEIDSFMKVKDILKIDFITYVKELKKLD